MIRLAVILFIFMGVMGCAGLCRDEKADSRLNFLNETILNKNFELQKKNERIEQLEKTVYQLEEKLKEKDSKIAILKNKLKGFGVFE